MKSASAFSTNNLSEHRAFQVLQCSISQNRLAQSVLLHGEDIHALEQIAAILGADILRTRPEKIPSHPDCFFLRTRGKGRQINIGQIGEKTQGEWPPNTMRRFIHDIHHSPQAGERKVGIVVEADRMNDSTANAFLKTLEEPPADTTLFLLTTRPYDLLDTIRSRCLNFKLPSELQSVKSPVWKGWLNDYRNWLKMVSEGPTSKHEVARATLGVYGLVARFEGLLEEETERVWSEYKDSLPENLNDDERAALESGLSKSIRTQLFGDIEQATRDFAVHSNTEDHRVFHRRLNRATQKLERVAWLMDRVYLKENAALEAFLLDSLRNWSGRG